MKVLFLYPNFYGMNMLPTGVGLLISHLSKAGHTSEIFDTTQYINWFGEDNDKKKTENLSARTYDDDLIRKGDKHTSPIDDFR